MHYSEEANIFKLKITRNIELFGSIQLLKSFSHSVQKILIWCHDMSHGFKYFQANKISIKKFNEFDLRNIHNIGSSV